MLRDRVDDLIIAEEMYRYLVAQAKQEGRRVDREAFIERITDALKMDPTTLFNYLNRPKRLR
jgi:hypothetical protein